MSVKVKICGLRTPESLDAALDAGADYFGLVFYPPSPRDVDIPTARELVRHGRGRGRAKSVALMVDPDDDSLHRILADVEPDLVQLHGTEPPERVRDVKAIVERPVIKAVRVSSSEDVAASRQYDGAADLVLYDAKPPTGTGLELPGGNGVPFDWKLLEDVKGRKQFILSGGLDPENVAEAIAATGTRFVDVSSGVESAPGVKDPDKIRAFIAAVRSAA